MAIGIATQPTASQITYTRSPIFYKFDGLTAGYVYYIKVYIDNVVYASIRRQPNIDNLIVIDIHKLVENYFRDNIDSYNNNVVKIQCIGEEYNLENETPIALTTSSISYAVLGYTTYEEGINYNRGTIFPMCSDADTFYLPNYSDTVNGYNLSFSNTHAGGSWEYEYTDISGNTIIDDSNTFFTASSNDKFIQKIACGYSNFTNIDITKPIIVSVIENSTLIKQYTIKPIESNCQDLNYISFLNKYGAWDQIFIRNKVETSLSTTSDTYKQNNFNYTSMDYGRNGSYHKSFINGKSKLMVNTGWVSEDLNDKMEELFLSGFVYYNDNPVILVDKNLKYKTHKWDNLINYSLELEYAYDKINNIK